LSLSPLLSWRMSHPHRKNSRRQGPRRGPGGRARGGDYGFAANPQGGNARNLELFVQHFGFSPNEVLQAATRTGGEAMRQPDQLGRVKAGYLADLLLVDGDPLADIRVLQDNRRFAFIMKGGVRYLPCEGTPHVRRLH
jgi:imidazolonepropionase-like amidohydrolase